MNKLQQAREIINRVDKTIADLFIERMSAAKMVAEYKKELGLPILDKEREQAILDNNVNYIEDDQLKPYYLKFMQDMMATSRLYQHELISGSRIAYCGVEGAFAHIAAKRIFPDGNIISFPSFKACYEAVENGEADQAVLPIENSYAGEVDEVLDLMFSGELKINGIYDLPVIHNLLGKKGAKREDIKTVISHPQALAQCANYIADNSLLTQVCSNTAVAAKKVASEDDYTVGAIASLETAELYDLEVLDKEINESNSNTTRFAVFSKASVKKVSSKDKSFLLIFTVSHVAGSLAKAVDIIGDYGFNMRVIKSRPTKDLNWSYYFYVEADGDITSENGQNMIKDLSEYCHTIKVVGNYASSRPLLNKLEG